MRLILLGANVAMLLLLGVYLLDAFSIRSIGMNGIGFLFVSSVAGLLLVNHVVEEHKLKNAFALMLPGAFVAVSPFVFGAFSPLSFILGVMLIVPGLVMLVRNVVRG